MHSHWRWNHGHILWIFMAIGGKCIFTWGGIMATRGKCIVTWGGLMETLCGCSRQQGVDMHGHKV
jgi:hypothetical protein